MIECKLKPMLWLLAVCFLCGTLFGQQLPNGIQNQSGIRLIVAQEDNEPSLHVVLPGSADSDRTIYVLFPEHITVRKRGVTEAEHLFLFRAGKQGPRPHWQSVGNSLHYERDFEPGIHMLARATLEDDGVRFSYQFVNRSKVDYDMIYAVTDPRLTGMFHDVRLERTYVHHKEGFDLLASETPSRLTMPLNEWLPSRYLVSFTWPIPIKRVERREDGITYYNKSRSVDEPMIATLSTDRQWVVASFSQTTGNVWSNPELTCQHVDPTRSLLAGQKAEMEVKMLIQRGSLNEVLVRVKEQRSKLK